MKKIAFLSFVLLAVFTTATFAQTEKTKTTTTTTTKTTTKNTTKTAEQRTDMFVNKMNEKLALNADQSTQIRAIVLKREKMRDAGQLDKYSREQIVGDINLVLTKDQQDKFMEMRKEAREKHEQNKANQNKTTGEKSTDDIY